MAAAVVPALEVRDLRVAYGRVQVLHGVTLSVNDGQVTCLIGANGAGKSTTLKAVVGLLRPSAGSIRCFGTELTRLPAHRIARHRVALVPEGRRVFASLSVLDNLRVGTVPAGGGWHRAGVMDEVFELFPELVGHGDREAGLLSGGQQQMLAIGRAMMAKPRLLVLDEPSMGLAPLVVERIYQALYLLKARGTTVLLAEQNARLALKFADQAYVLETGHVVEHGSADELRSSERVDRAYLGG